MARTRIICTIGPASSTKEVILGLAQHGMSVARCNMAHGTHQSHAQAIAVVREVSRELERSIEVMVDVKGPEIRTGDVREPLKISKGQEVVFSPRPYEVRMGQVGQEGKVGKERTVIEVNYDAFAEDVKEAELILVDGGELEFELVTIEGLNVIARAKQGGVIASRRHINLPGADVDMPAITAKDWEDITFALREGADMIALSFIRSSDNVTSVRRFLGGHQQRPSPPAARGERWRGGSARSEPPSQPSPLHPSTPLGVKGEGVHPKIVAKIETRQALNDLTAIVEAADLVMVARGDLGCEVTLEALPRIQDEIVSHCKSAGKPVIIATHMLESMTEHPVPTRAELTDIAHAVATGADYVMLSGETAHGKYPVKVVETMRKTLEEAEK